MCLKDLCCKTVTSINDWDDSEHSQKGVLVSRVAAIAHSSSRTASLVIFLLSHLRERCQTHVSQGSAIGLALLLFEQWWDQIGNLPG